MTISLFGAVACLLLLVIPFTVFYQFSIEFSRRLLIALLRMVLWLVCVGIVAKGALLLGHWTATLLACLFFVALSSVLACFLTRQSFGRVLVPILGGIASMVLLSMALLMGMVVTIDVKADAALPTMALVGLLSGGMTLPVSEALRSYYSGLDHRSALYYYLTANGAKPAEALRYLMRRAVQRAAAPGIRRIGGLMVAATPMVLWASMAAGLPLFTALTFEFVVAVAVFSSSIGAAVIALLLARRLSLDSFSRVKD